MTGRPPMASAAMVSSFKAKRTRDQREKFPRQREHKANPQDRGEIEADAWRKAEDAAEQRRRVVLEGVVVIELLMWQPKIERQQLLDWEIIRDEMKVGNAVAVVADLRRSDPPERAIASAQTNTI